MEINKKILAVALGLFLVPGIFFKSVSQNRKLLEIKRKRAQEEIDFTKQILKKTSQKKSAALYNLNAVNQIISKRSQIIGNLKNEIVEADSEIHLKAENYESLQKRFLTEKAKLHKTIVNAYKSRKSANELAFVFAAGTFRQAVRRLKYLKRLSEFRTFLIARINQKKDSVNHGLTVLEEGKKEKVTLLTDEEKEKTQLESEKNEKNILVKSLSGQENALRKKIRENEIAVSKLNASISKMIAEEIAIARRKAQKAATATASKTGQTRKTGAQTKPAEKNDQGSVSLTPEAREISTSFEANRGSLIWPVERGFISQGFGVHAHPDLSGITLINNGVDITTGEGSEVRAVFRGTVSAIINIPGQEKALLVNHGEYFTVYSRLSTVFVTRGQTITSRQTLGKVWTDGDGKTILQFQIWKGQVKQNPAAWLANR
jgi:septal ring factor EnvC (AmiA/AmiB activator)